MEIGHHFRVQADHCIQTSMVPQAGHTTWEFFCFPDLVAAARDHSPYKNSHQGHKN
jgi:hypothetical protein